MILMITRCWLIGMSVNPDKMLWKPNFAACYRPKTVEFREKIRRVVECEGAWTDRTSRPWKGNRFVNIVFHGRNILGGKKCDAATVLLFLGSKVVSLCTGLARDVGDVRRRRLGLHNGGSAVKDSTLLGPTVKVAKTKSLL